MEIRDARRGDLAGLMNLYAQLHDEPMVPVNAEIEAVWSHILQDERQHVIVAVEHGKTLSSCILTIIPNLTHNHRPYALIENVITDKENRGRGIASQIFEHAKKLAVEADCYKIMLVTGRKAESTLNFYRKMGYSSEEKTAFVQWL